MPLVIYLLIGSLFLGIAMGNKSNRCGTYQSHRAEKALAVVLTWPMVFGLAATLDDGIKVDEKCEKST